MTKEIYISSTPHETRLAIVEDEQLVEVHYERENEYSLAGSMYKGKVTRVLPGMQSAFVDIGLERDAFLYVTDFLEDQEDSGEFERTALPPPAKAAAGHAPRTSPPATTAEEQPAAEAGAEVDQQSAEGDREAGGARRWRGRRGRKRNGRENTGAPEQAETPSAPQSEGTTLEISSDDFDFAPEEAVAQHVVLEEPSDDWHSPVAAPLSEAPHAADQEEPFEAPRRRERSRHDAPSGQSANVLPGESLSKYGGKSDAQTAESGSRPALKLTSKPSTLVDSIAAPITWGDSMVLPGESLSRHRPKTQPTRPAAPPQETPADEADTFLQPLIPPHDWKTEAHYAAPELSAEGAGEEAVESSEAELHEEAIAATENGDAEHEFTEETVDEETVEEEAHANSDSEDGPSNASASHRFDPNPPSEFRLPWSRKPKSPDDHDPHTGNTPEDRERRKLAHDVGSDMASHSKPAVEVFPGVPDFVDEDGKQGAGHGRHFSPGAGQVEEETIEGDEFEMEPMRRHMDDHDSDDLVEETMEHSLEGADIGEFVRDTYVNERTSLDFDGEEDDEDSGTAGDVIIESEEPSAEQPGGAPRQRRGRRGRRGQPLPSTPAAETKEPRKDDRREGRRDAGRKGGNGNRRQSAQTSSIPIITELLKPGQEILVQIAKEPIAKKGARITSHIALPGRFLVYMPTVNHVGVSRKIASDEERQRLKRVLLSEKADAGGGFIVRTAADNATEQELRADIRFLINLWTEIKQRSETAKPPSLIYHDLNLVERILRDQVTDKFSAIWVDTEVEYERVVKFLNRFQPSLVRHVKLYSKETPLFEQFGIQDEINKALKSKVWLKSGGSIVINQTEALVAIDINTGKYVGKTARLEDTILKTNLDAIPEIVRQVRLRDLGGIIVIDFIDMDERRNRHKVMAALEEELKRDRAPSKVLQFNDFGLVAITRKRVKQSLERTLSMPCITCQGTGMVKNPTTVCNEIYVELRKMHRHLDRGDVMLRVHPEVVKQLKTNGARWLQDMEEMAGRTILIKSDAAIHPEQFDVH